MCFPSIVRTALKIIGGLGVTRVFLVLCDLPS